MSAATASATPLNVLWILCDELRADALGCYGNAQPEVVTPHIDQLAAEGVIFDNAYTASPICVPARAAMFTGQNPTTTGIYGNEAQAPGYPVPPGLIAFTQMLAEAGWVTHSYGKEHVPAALQPWQYSDESRSMQELMTDARRVNAEVLRTPAIGHVVGARLPEGAAFSAEAVTRNTVAAIAELPAPFLVRASYLQPHTPVVVPEPWASQYAGVPFGGTVEGRLSELEQEFGRVNAGAQMDDEDLAKARELYYGAVAWLDGQVGQLLGELERRGLGDSTVVVLTADHGAYLGEDGAFGKHTFAPQSHRVPLIIRCPSRVPGGQRRGDLASSEDLAATVLGLCGVRPPTTIDSRDLFADNAPDHIVSVIGYGGPSSLAFPLLGVGTFGSHGWPQRLCVRSHRYRLDLNIRVDGRPADERERDLFLVDRLNDPAERWNLADDPRYAGVLDGLIVIALHAAESAMTPDDESVYGVFEPPEASKEFRTPQPEDASPPASP